MARIDRPSIKDICELVRALNLAHPFVDGSGSAFCIRLLNTLLLANGHHAAIQYDTRYFAGATVEELVEKVTLSSNATEYLNRLLHEEEQNAFIKTYYRLCRVYYLPKPSFSIDVFYQVLDAAVRSPLILEEKIYQLTLQDNVSDQTLLEAINQTNQPEISLLVPLGCA